MRQFLLAVSVVLILGACGRSTQVIREVEVTEVVPVTRIVEATRLVEVTRIVEVATEVAVIVTPTPLTAKPTPEAAPTPVPAPISATTARIEQGVNLREGPGTNYPIAGSLGPGDSVEVLARIESGEWDQVVLGAGKQAWVASWLLIDAPDKESLPIAQDIPTPPPATSVPEPGEATTPVSPESQFRSIGEEIEGIEGGGWRFNVKEVHKRKAVYFYGDSYVAQGLFLIVIIDAVNLQSGTDYFGRNIKPYVVNYRPRGDEPRYVWRQSSTGTSYAQWQYDGISSIYTNVNPGVFTRMAMAFDLPVETGRVLLSTETLEWIDLGIFSTLPLEE